MAGSFSETDMDEISAALDEFSRDRGEISQTLDRYLMKIAKNGIIVFPWSKLKPVLAHKLDIVIRDFHERSPMNASSPRPNMEQTTFEELHQRIMDMLLKFTGAPFTIQRLCELVTNPSKHYQKTEKFMRGLEKNLVVVTTVDSFGNRVVQESKSLVNGLDSAGIDDNDIDTSLCDQNSYLLDSHLMGSPYVPSAPRSSPSASPLSVRSTWPANNSNHSHDMFNSDSHAVNSDDSMEASGKEEKVEDDEDMQSSSERLSNVGDVSDHEDRTGESSDISSSSRVARSPATRRRDHSDLDSADPPRKQARLDCEKSSDDNSDNSMKSNIQEKSADSLPTSNSSSMFAPILGLLLGNQEKVSSSIESSSVDTSDTPSGKDSNDNRKEDDNSTMVTKARLRAEAQVDELKSEACSEQPQDDSSCVQSSVDPPGVQGTSSSEDQSSMEAPNAASDSHVKKERISGTSQTSSEASSEFHLSVSVERTGCVADTDNHCSDVVDSPQQNIDTDDQVSCSNTPANSAIGSENSDDKQGLTTSSGEDYSLSSMQCETNESELSGSTAASDAAAAAVDDSVAAFNTSDLSNSSDRAQIAATSSTQPSNISYHNVAEHLDTRTTDADRYIKSEEVNVAAEVSKAELGVNKESESALDTEAPMDTN